MFCKDGKQNCKNFKSESGCAIYWFRENRMIAKPDKFQAILLDKRNSDFYLNKNIRIDKENIKIVPNVKMLSRCSY